jgi:hypothetical protein
MTARGAATGRRRRDRGGAENPVSAANQGRQGGVDRRRSASAYRRGSSDRRLDSLAGGVRRGDIGFFGERLRLWRRDAGFVLWHGFRLLRLRLALLAFTLGIQDVTGQTEPPLISIRDAFYPPSASKNRGRLHSRGFAHENHVARSASALHHKLGRIPNPIDLQEDRISVPHGSQPAMVYDLSSALRQA